MMMSLRTFGLFAACTVLATAASAQTSATQSPAADPRPAFATSEGDTGLWFVPTAEVLAHGKWSVSGYRVATNYVQGFSNVAGFPVTFAVGIARRAEVFGSLAVDTRIDRDLRPIFTSDPEVGGVIARYPFVKRGWTGDNLGDLLVGVKVNLLSEERQKAAAVAVRGSVKLPTGDKDAGVSTGKADVFLDLVVSKDVRNLVEVAGYGGAAFRGKPEEVTQSNGLRWGVGVGFPSHSPLRFTGEIAGEKPFDDTLTLTSPIVAIDGSTTSGSSALSNQSAGTVGISWQQPGGFFVGAGMTWTFPRQDRSDFRTDADNFGDFVDYQFRIGYHPGVARRYTAPPPPPPPPPAPPAPPANRAPTIGGPDGQGGASGSQSGVQITSPTGAPCNPCTVEPGQTVTLTATAQDPDGDALSYRWTAPAGTFSDPTGRTTQWTAPANQDGPVPITVTVDDGKGGTTSSTTTIQVTRPAPIVELNFEDVYFDFDRSTLRPEALRLLDDAVAKLQANPGKNLIIEGHTCNIGTAEYNLALGERRARGVVTYLTAHGVSANRLDIVSYGEERPKFDNSREETRRLNRRAALVVKVQ